MSVISDRAAPAPAARPPLYRSLFFQLPVAIVAGILVGALAPAFGSTLTPVADTFINLIKICIAPIIFFTVVVGIGHVGDLGAVLGGEDVPPLGDEADEPADTGAAVREPVSRD